MKRSKLNFVIIGSLATSCSKVELGIRKKIFFQERLILVSQEVEEIMLYFTSSHE